MDQTLKINGDSLFMETNVENITFAGIESELLTMMEGTPMEGAIQIPFDKFGWFYDVSRLLRFIKGDEQSSCFLSIIDLFI